MGADIPTEQILHALKTGLGPFVLKIYSERFGVNGSLGEIQKIMESRENGYRLSGEILDTEDALMRKIDAYGWLWLMEHAWQDRIWTNGMDRDKHRLARSFVNELLIHRNNWAHQKFNGGDSLRLADTAVRLLEIIGVHQQADIIRGLMHAAQPDNKDMTIHHLVRAVEVAEEDTDLVTIYTGDQYSVQIVLRDGETRQYVIEKDRIIVGRSDTNSDLVLQDRRVSRVHLLLLKTPDNTLTVTDLRSGNGTRLEEREIKPNMPVVWPVGTVITIGDTRLILRRV